MHSEDREFNLPAAAAAFLLMLVGAGALGFVIQIGAKAAEIPAPWSTWVPYVAACGLVWLVYSVISRQALFPAHERVDDL
ncbi:MAG: hypothetical protein WCW26_04030 [Candidatus Buchananbacteria bacterium]